MASRGQAAGVGVIPLKLIHLIIVTKSGRILINAACQDLDGNVNSGGLVAVLDS